MFLKKLKIELPHDTEIQFPTKRNQNHYLKEMSILFKFTAALFTIAKVWK